MAMHMTLTIKTIVTLDSLESEFESCASALPTMLALREGSWMREIDKVGCAVTDVIVMVKDGVDDAPGSNVVEVDCGREAVERLLGAYIAEQ